MFLKDVISAFEAKAAFITTAFFRSIRLCICTFFSLIKKNIKREKRAYHWLLSF